MAVEYLFFKPTFVNPFKPTRNMNAFCFPLTPLITYVHSPPHKTERVFLGNSAVYKMHFIQGFAHLLKLTSVGVEKELCPPVTCTGALGIWGFSNRFCCCCYLFPITTDSLILLNCSSSLKGFLLHSGYSLYCIYTFYCFHYYGIKMYSHYLDAKGMF